VARPHSTVTELGRRIAKTGKPALKIAQLADVNPRVLTDYLAGRAHPRPDHIVRLAGVLECDASDLRDPGCVELAGWAATTDPTPDRRPEFVGRYGG
jgi:hypothetical protein